MTKTKKQIPEKRPVGRPSKYKPEYCEMLMDHMATGLSFESFAGVIKTCDDTLREWEKVHPEFSAAKKVAFARNRVFWEQAAVDSLWDVVEYDESGKPLKSKKINSTLWIFNMKNRFGWTDKREVEMTNHVKLEDLITSSMSEGDDE